MKAEQVLIIDPPQELVFHGPFSEAVLTPIRLQNPTSKPILFKIKTTAPKKYVVRPNGGIIEAQASHTVKVMLQTHDLDLNEKVRHKFMVQSAFLPPDVTNLSNLEAIWPQIAADDIMDTKLKVAFDVPNDTQSPGDEVDRAEGSPVDRKPVKAPPPTGSPKLKSTSPKVRPAVSGSSGKQLEEARAEIRLLQEEIERLQLEQGTLRRRLGGSGMGSMSGKGMSGESTMMMAQQQQQQNIRPILYLVVTAVLGLLVGRFIIP